MEWALEDLKGFLNTWSPVQKYKDDYRTNPVDSVLDELTQYWEPGQANTVTFPIFLRLGKISQG